MSRLIMAGAFALAASIPLAPAIAQSGNDSSLEPSITVTAPHMRTTGRTSSGAPIRTVETNSHVYIGDLNLRTRAGRDELDYRVDAAAREACGFLDQHYGSMDDPPSMSRNCREDAVKMSQYQVRDAIERSAMVEYDNAGSGDVSYYPSGY